MLRSGERLSALLACVVRRDAMDGRDRRRRERGQQLSLALFARPSSQLGLLDPSPDPDREGASLRTDVISGHDEDFRAR